MSDKTANQGAGDPLSNIGDQMGKVFMLQVQLRHLPAFYLEILALGLPTFLFANGLLDRLKKRGSLIEAAPID